VTGCRRPTPIIASILGDKDGGRCSPAATLGAGSCATSHEPRALATELAARARPGSAIEPSQTRPLLSVVHMSSGAGARDRVALSPRRSRARGRC
jgi:hypothetical protein